MEIQDLDNGLNALNQNRGTKFLSPKELLKHENPFSDADKLLVFEKIYKDGYCQKRLMSGEENKPMYYAKL